MILTGLIIVSLIGATYVAPLLTMALRFTPRNLQSFLSNVQNRTGYLVIIILATLVLGVLADAPTIMMSAITMALALDVLVFSAVSVSRALSHFL